MTVDLQKRKVPGVMPHEHGAYVTLLTPLASALLFAPSLAGLAWAAMAFALFVAHEPLCLLLGRRGVRKRELGGDVARRTLACIAVFTVPSGLTLVLSSDALGRRALVVSGLLCVCAGLMLAAGREKTLPGELMATAALVGLSLPALALAAVPQTAAGYFMLAWLVVQWLAMLTARAYVYRKRTGRGLLQAATAIAASIIVVAFSASYAGFVPLSLCVAPCFVAIVTLGLTLGVFQPRSPKQLGWALAGAMLPAVALIGLNLP